jgi:2-oxoisovalerate dehydrogenase E1 component
VALERIRGDGLAATWEDFDLLQAYQTILTIRRFEERCQELRLADEISGSIHLSLGQEAIPAGALAALGEEDRVLATYRGHGWAIACGVPLRALFAETLGRATGTNGGRGGSAYLSSPEHRFLGENSIVGAGVPIACGVALAARARGRGVVLTSFGDGATSEGAVHEGMVMASAHALPVIFVCENNHWSENTPIDAIARIDALSERAAGYGMPGVTVDGDDPQHVFRAVVDAVERGRRGDGPTFIECVTHRLGGHYNADIEHYRPSADKERAVAADPLPRLRSRLVRQGAAESIELIDRSVDEAIDAAAEAALDDPPPPAETARDHVVATAAVTGIAPAHTGPASELTYGQAVNEALRRELAERPEVIVFGEDVAIPGGVFGVTRNLRKEFGLERVFDTAIAESAILGAAVGCSQEGLVPIAEIMWSDFLLVALDQLVNQAANVRYLHEGSRCAPLVVRCQQGVTPGSCAQHSQSLEALLAHIPGLIVGMPSNPQDAYAMTRAAVAEPDPVILIECRALYSDKGAVQLEAPTERIGGARTTIVGTDLAIVTWGRMTKHVIEAAGVLAEREIGPTVVDLRWLTPLDRASIAAAASSCARVLVVHEANLTGGFGGEVVSVVVEEAFFDLDAPPRRLGSPDVRFPAAPSLSAPLLPNVDAITAAAEALVRA